MADLKNFDEQMKKLDGRKDTSAVDNLIKNTPHMPDHQLEQNFFNKHDSFNDTFNQPDILKQPMPMPVVDKRTETEKRSDHKEKIDAIDKQDIIELQELLVKNAFPEEIGKKFHNILEKCLSNINLSESLNSEESRKIKLKEQELKLDAKHDWKEKFRSLFFRFCGSIIFVCTLFLIGWLDKQEWATLPLSNYLKPVVNKLKVNSVPLASTKSIQIKQKE